jgi:hypothetical protein
MQMADVLVIWVIYDHPCDYPDHFVVRRHFVLAHPSQVIPRDVAPHGTAPGSNPRIWLDRGAAIVPTLEAARAVVPPGLSWFPRHPSDDPCVAETWL